MIFCWQVLFEYARSIGLDLGQVGYQAVAYGCQRESDGMELLMKMKVQRTISVTTSLLPSPHKKKKLHTKKKEEKKRGWIQGYSKMQMYM